MTKYSPKWVEEAIKDGKNPFFIQIPVTENYEHQGVRTIVGLGSKTERSRSGHKMSQEFIAKMKETAIGKPLFLGHNPDLVAGKIVDVKESSSDEIIPVAELLTPSDNPITDMPRSKIEHWLDNGIALGLSFGGLIDKFKMSEDDDGNVTFNIQDGELLEFSVTPIPAVKSSDGSVKAVKQCGVCQMIAEQVESGANLPEINDLPYMKQSDLDIKDKEITLDSDDSEVVDELFDVSDDDDEEVDDNKNQINGDIMENEKLQKIEEGLATLLEDYKQRKQTEQEAKEKAERDAEIKQALDEQEKAHKQEIEDLKESFIEATKEVVAEIIGDRKGVAQASRIVKEEDEEEELEQASEMTVDEQYKSSVFAPAVVKGEIMKQAYTPIQFVEMVAKAQ